MHKKLREYLQQCTPAKTDQVMLDRLRDEMDKAVPRIAEKIKRREELAAELRIAGLRPSKSKKGKRH